MKIADRKPSKAGVLLGTGSGITAASLAVYGLGGRPGAVTFHADLVDVLDALSRAGQVDVFLVEDAGREVQLTDRHDQKDRRTDLTKSSSDMGADRA